jgi:pilus assembly protein CpaF
MLQAMNTGHEGSLTTTHANTPRDCIARLETMIMMAGFELPVKAMRTQIASAVNLIIQANRLQGGKRKVTHITEIVGMENDTIVMQDIFNASCWSTNRPAPLSHVPHRKAKRYEPRVTL